MYFSFFPLAIRVESTVEPGIELLGHTSATLTEKAIGID